MFDNSFQLHAEEIIPTGNSLHHSLWSIDYGQKITTQPYNFLTLNTLFEPKTFIQIRQAVGLKIRTATKG